MPVSGFTGFNLRTVSYPSQYVLLINSKGNTLTAAVWSVR